MRLARILLVSLQVTLAACGGGGSTSDTASTVRIIYDEAIQGALPFGIFGLTDDKLARITFDLASGMSQVRGTSTGGERFLVKLDASEYISSIKVQYSTHIDNNDHVLFVLPYPAGSAKITNIHHMETIGDYEFVVQPADQSITAGTFEVYSGTSVQGASRENPYSLTITVNNQTP